MIGFVFNAATFSYLALSVYFCIVAAYFLSISHKTLSSWLMTAFFLSLTAAAVTSALISASAIGFNFIHPVQMLFLALGLVFLLQFSCRFPLDLGRESRIVLGVSIIVFLCAALDLGLTISGYPQNILPYVAGVKTGLVILIGIEFAWCVWNFFQVFIRRYAFSLRQIIKNIRRPSLKEERAARGLILLGILTIALFAALVRLTDLSGPGLAPGIAAFFAVWLVTLLAIHYLNYSPVQTSLIPKFTCLAQASVVSVFLVMGHLLPPSMPFFFVLVAASIFIVLVVPYFLRQNLILPLYSLLGGVEKINAGTWKAALPVTYNDEIGTLADAYNSMINTVQIAAKALRQANLSLEQKVIEQQHLLDELHNAHENLQSVSRHFIETQEKERRLLAGELHDEIGQALTGIKLTLEMSRKSPDLTHFTGEAQELISDLVRRVNDMSLNLRPVMLDEFGLLPALLFLFDNYTRQTGVEVFFQQNGLEENRYVSEVETAAYRIIQEGLTNTARHAGVKEVSVRILIDNEKIFIEIEDHGRGFVSSASTRFSYGLAGMAERAALIGGELEIESAPEAGTFIWAKIPVEPKPVSPSSPAVQEVLP